MATDLHTILTAATSTIAGGVIVGSLAKWFFIREVQRLDKLQTVLQEAIVQLATTQTKMEQIAGVKQDLKEHHTALAILGKDLAVLQKDLDHAFHVIRALTGTERLPG